MLKIANILILASCFIFPNFFGTSLVSSTSGLQAKSTEEIILYARARGKFGDELRTYWDAVKNSSLSQKAIRDYPPHCSLTGFFNRAKTDEEYIADLETAIRDLGDVDNSVFITGLVRGANGGKFDYIGLQSTYLANLTTQFVDIIGINTKYIKNPDQYHITLSNHAYKNKKNAAKIAKLQHAIKLSAESKWSVFLYKRKGGPGNKVELIKEIPLQ
jgi:hypothetical protein